MYLDEAERLPLAAGRFLGRITNHNSLITRESQTKIKDQKSNESALSTEH